MLKFNNGKFRILIFGDLHEHDDYIAEGKKRFLDMQKMMNAALDEYKPDICVFLGDNCSITTLFKKEDRPGFIRMINDVARPITSRGIPVYAILGNHEHDIGDGDEVVSAYRESDVIMRNDAPPEISGNANYSELIYSSDGERPLFNLWFLDSNNLFPDSSVSHYDCVHPDQIEWYEKRAAELARLNGGRPFPAFVFQHTPVYEEYNLLRKAKLWEYPWAVRGYGSRSGIRYVGRDGVKGYVGEGPCSPEINMGQFEAWKRVGDVKAAFFGHDHLNDFSGWVDGIYLAQHKTGGFRAYTDGCRCCVRCVTINENDLSWSDELKHFKEFGLKNECLGPVFSFMSDRVSTNLHILGRVAGCTAGSVAVSVAATKIIKEIKKQ